ncbi:hypothetical protein TNCV_4068701 [Trichonephila clavipes]|nr:hypothetical protein TNCV_4068701 [Trichonephila clavipes]
MKTSSVNFNTPSPMESKHRRFTMLRKIFQPWQWKRRKKRNRFEQTSRTLREENIDAFSSGLDEKGKKEDVPLRTAATVQAGRLWQRKAKSTVFAREAQLMRTETVKTLRLLREQKLKRRAERTQRCASEWRYLLHIIVKLIC